MSQVHAFFDFDDTLLAGDSILYWLRFYYARRPLRRAFQVLNGIGILLHVLRLMNSAKLKRLFLMPMGFESPSELDRLAQAFVREDLARRFHVPVLRRLWTHHLLGHKVVIISASATFYLRHLKFFLPMADIQGTEMIWPRGFGLPRYADSNLRGPNKIDRLKKLGLGDAGPLSFAYSDHQHDEPLLRFSEFPTCVRPTPRLRKLARAEGWPILDWGNGDVTSGPDADGTQGPDASRSSEEARISGPARKAAGPGLWRTRLGKLQLLLFAAGEGVAPTGSDPLREAALARDYAPAEVRKLRDRVALKYPDGTAPEAYHRIFGGPAR